MDLCTETLMRMGSATMTDPDTGPSRVVGASMAERLNWTDSELREEQQAMQSYVDHWEDGAIE